MIAASIAPWPVVIWFVLIGLIVLTCWALGREGGLAKEPPARARKELDALEEMWDRRG